MKAKKKKKIGRTSHRKYKDIVRAEQARQERVCDRENPDKKKAIVEI